MILLTGFKPFLGQDLNPSLMLAKKYHEEFPSSSYFLELPVEYQTAQKRLEQFIESLPEFPQQVLLLGQAAGRSQICLERVALNWIESQHVDEAGQVSVARRIIAEAPAAYIQEEWTFDVGSLPKEIKVSHSAGTYVCNELYFRALHKYSSLRKQICFVHVPLLPEQAKQGEASMSFEQQYFLLKNLIEVMK
ncbi:MAG: pyroglutamyl-peptidase I [Bdellovibrionia bacterium]